MNSTPSAAPSEPPQRLLAIGNFDGVHRGHQHLLSSIAEQARELGLEPKVLTFSPHPAVVLGRAERPMLTRLQRKIELIERSLPGLSVIVEQFDAQMAAMSPGEFAERVLVERHRAGRVVVGENFRFGRERAGDLQTLIALGEQLGFSAAALRLLEAGGEAISSSRIREMVLAGEVQAAAELLGREHALLGRVVPGDQLGRQLGFPTANLAEVQELLPRHGVYACRVHVPARASSSLPAICNIGTRPTVSGGDLSVEVHLMDYDGDLYGERLELLLVQRLRGEQRFASTEALRQQIASDVSLAKRLLAGERAP